jgi:hypothetical protein
MCIIVLNKKDTIKKNVLKRCWNSNDDGGGIGYIEKGELKIYKNLLSFNDFYTFYNKIRQKNKLPIMLHFRISTGGLINEENIHPFQVNKNLIFSHNGILSIKPNEKYSDTVLFNELILKKLDKNFIYNDGIKLLLEHFCGNYNKLVFLDNTGKYIIINEAAGVWDGENWYSNCSYLPYEKPKYKYLKSYNNYNFDTLKYNEYDYSGFGETCEYCNEKLITTKNKVNGLCDNCFYSSF